jgi:hypothetical protein
MKRKTTSSKPSAPSPTRPAPPVPKEPESYHEYEARRKAVSEETKLSFYCEPPQLMSQVRDGPTALIATRVLNIFYTYCDLIEKAVRALKAKCRDEIIARRDEGTPTGDRGQHREFTYDIPEGKITLTVQESRTPKFDDEKLEALLKRKNLWNSAITTIVDPEKVRGLILAKLITAEELAGVCSIDPSYSLIAKVDTKGGAV